MATWSRDGRWIYFNSMRSGRRQVWRMPAAGGDSVQITTGGGLRPVESPDGKSIFYVAESGGAIWRVPKDGGQETEVVSCVHQTAYGFALTANGIYYRDCSESKKQYIRFFNLTTRQSRPVAEASAPPFGTSLSVSPDGKYLLFDQAGNIDTDLILLEEFRVP
jgi:Tol biopolymer transport system component